MPRYFRLTHTVNEDLVRYMDGVGGNSSFLVKDPIWAEDFAPNGKQNILYVHYSSSDSFCRHSRQAWRYHHEEAVRKVGDLTSQAINIQSLTSIVPLRELPLKEPTPSIILTSVSYPAKRF